MRTRQWWLRDSGLVRGAIFYWVVLIAVTSTAGAPAGVRLTWPQSLRRSMLMWTVWAILTPLIIQVDQWLPISEESPFKRIAAHIPLSLIFTTLMQFLMSLAVTVIVKSGPELAIDSFDRSFRSGVFQSNVLIYWVVLFAYV